MNIYYLFISWISFENSYSSCKENKRHKANIKIRLFFIETIYLRDENQPSILKQRNGNALGTIL